MNKACSAIVIFIAICACCGPAAGQYSLADRLQSAATSGDSAAVQLLLDKGADINAQDRNGYTALMRAVLNNQRNVVDLLLARGANIEIKDSQSKTVLRKVISDDSYAKLNRVEVDIVKLLLDKGAIAEVPDDQGRTPLIETSRISTYLWGKYKPTIAKMLLEKGANLEAKDTDGKTALDYANTNGPAELVDVLEEARQQRKLLAQAQAKTPDEKLTFYLSALQRNPRMTVCAKRL